MYVKSAGLVTLVAAVQSSLQLHEPPPGELSKDLDEIYAPFMLTGFVSLDYSDTKPVDIPRYSGATQSFILKHILLFSISTDRGDTTPVLGISLVPVSVPLHRLTLTSSLVNGGSYIFAFGWGGCYIGQ